MPVSVEWLPEVPIFLAVQLGASRQKLVIKWGAFTTMHQVAVLVPDEKLHVLISDAQFFFQKKTKQLSSGTSIAT